jgi:predicted nucleotidyltransferase
VFGSLARGEGNELSDALVDLLPRDLARPEVLARALGEGLEVHG